MGLALAERDLFISQWPHEESLSPPPPGQTEISDADEFSHWLRNAKPGVTAQYHRGCVANFKGDGPLELSRLQYLSDNEPLHSPRPAHERVRAQQIIDRLELLAAVTRAVDVGMVHVTQRRIGPGRFQYFVTKKGYRS